MGRMVCQLGGILKYRVYSHTVDMRKSFRGLAGIVHSEIGPPATISEMTAKSVSGLVESAKKLPEKQ